MRRLWVFETPAGLLVGHVELAEAHRLCLILEEAYGRCTMHGPWTGGVEGEALSRLIDALSILGLRIGGGGSAG